MATAPAAEAINGYVYPPADAETLHLFHPPTPEADVINEYIINHSLAQSLRGLDGVTESRPLMKVAPAMRSHNFSAGTLLGDGKLAVPPLQFRDRRGPLPKLVVLAHLGTDLCGHPGIIHGGLLATLLDEGLARACMPALPNQICVTANLNINYRSPCPENSYIALKAETTKLEGRKAWVTGWIELLDEEGGTGTKIAEAEALFIEPRSAKNMPRAIAAAA